MSATSGLVRWGSAPAPSPADAAAHSLLMGAALQFALLLPCLLAYAGETRLVNDVNVWAKPIKFQLSLGLLLLTVWLLMPLLPAALRARRRVRWPVLVLVLSCAFDMLVFVLQSARGVASHFNHATPLDDRLYGLTGLVAVCILAAVAWLGWLMRRPAPADAGTPAWDRPGLRAGAAWGLMLGAASTLVVAGLMAAEGLPGQQGHWVGGVPSDAQGLPLLGWSTLGGDLRVPHFFATHLMQALPLLGWAVDRTWGARHRQAGPRAVGAGAVFGLLLVAGTFVQALMGRPFV